VNNRRVNSRRVNSRRVNNRLSSWAERSEVKNDRLSAKTAIHRIWSAGEFEHKAQ
jgi:hypothetical protein